MSGSPDILLQLELAGKNKLVVHCLTQNRVGITPSVYVQGTAL